MVQNLLHRVKVEASYSDSYWRLVPPEEKLEILFESQGKGIVATTMFVFFGIILSVGYYFPWLILASLFFAPIVYKSSSNRVWNRLKAEKLIYYLAARSALRRFAYSFGAKDLEPKIIIKAELEEFFDDRPIFETKMPVVAALFEEVVIVIQERPGGAILRFGSLLGPKLMVYSDRDKIILKKKLLDQERFEYCLTSKYPVALKAFSDMLQSYQNRLTSYLKPQSFPQEPQTEEQAF